MNPNDWIETARNIEGLTQRDLAVRSGIKQSRISRIENGSEMKVNELQQIAKALNVDPCKILTEGVNNNDRNSN